MKSLLWLLCFSLNVISARPMFFFMSSLATLVTIVLYTACGVRHSLFRGKLSSYQQLHLFNSVLGFKIFLLWDEIAELIFLMQLYLIFTMFLCKILCRTWMVGKCSFSNFENTAPTLVFTFFEWDGLNHIIFLLSFLALFFSSYCAPSAKPLSFSALL